MCFSAKAASAGVRWEPDARQLEALVDESSISEYISATFPGVDVAVGSREAASPEISWGDTFFIYDPNRDLEGPRRFPFATIVTKDYGQVLFASLPDAETRDLPLERIGGAVVDWCASRAARLLT